MFNKMQFGPAANIGAEAQPKQSPFSGMGGLGSIQKQVMSSPGYQQLMAKYAAENPAPTQQSSQFQITPEMAAGMRQALEGLQGAPGAQIQSLPMLPPGSAAPQFTKPSMVQGLTPDMELAFMNAMRQAYGGGNGQG